MTEAARLRAWHWHRQGLDGSLAGSPAAEVLARSGWARSVGGAAPYLALYARAGISREAADAAIEALEIHELPSARGCVYVVPASDFAIALRAGEGFSADVDLRKAAKLGVPAKEIERLCRAVLDAVSKAALTPDEIRATVGGAVRSLGEAGKKQGLSTTLPVALGKLQQEGEIRRVALDGRLDRERYRYVRWKDNPLAASKMSKKEASVELARRYFRWAGPASLKEFQGFSGFGVKVANEAIEPLRLSAVGEGLLLPEDRDPYERFKAPAKPQYALVGSLDSIVLLRRDVAGLLDPADASHAAMKGSGLSDLPSHAIFDRGRLIGLWEYDPDGKGSIAWTSWIKPDAALKKAVADTERFVREQLGDARSYSLDTPTKRARRISALRG